MQKNTAIAFFLIVVILVSGCNDAEFAGVESTAKAITPDVIITTPTVQHTVPTAVPLRLVITTQATPNPTGLPLKSMVSIKIDANGILRFEAQNSGRIRIAASTHIKEPDCDSQGALILNGDNFETPLAESSQRTVREIITLPSAGTYTLTSRGCYRWTVKIENY